MNKNDIISLEITGLTQEGNGVGRHDGLAVFVPFVAVSDKLSVRIVKLKKSHAYGIIENITEPSPERLQPDCAAFFKCGGCAFRHISYSAELRAKHSFVVDAFVRLGGLTPAFEDILPSPSVCGYRNKAQYPVASQNGKIVCGFYSRRSHRIIPFTDCLLQPPVFKQIADDITQYANDNRIEAYSEENGRGVLRHIYLRRGENSGEVCVCLVCAKKYDFGALAQMLTEKYDCVKTVTLNINPENTNVILGKHDIVISGSGTINDIMCGNKITLSPKSFYQVNTRQAERLYGIAADYARADADSFILDLYCGAGTIGLSMSPRVRRVLGVEIVPEAVDNAKLNALNNNITNAEFICADAAQAAKRIAQGSEYPDIIILDPPRKGCDAETLAAAVKMKPERIVMVSCNPATAARDCAALAGMGYIVEKVRPVDMFPRTTHVETVALMSRNQIKTERNGSV